jgi:hypothetical protein
MRRSTSAILLGAALLASASVAVAEPAATINGSAALALAGVIAPHSPNLSAPDKKTVAAFFDGGVTPYGNTITISADKIVCRTSNVDIAARSCEINFGKTGTKLSGRAANEIYATMAMAGIPPDGAAGTVFESVSKLNCTLEPAAIKEKAGGGVTCAYEPGN